MKLILLSGGSGKRLWPLSNDTRSKQFLKVLKNNKGVYESMVQRVWRQLDLVGLKDDSIIATGKSQVDMLHNQIGQNVPIITEPERRDTFPAIALAAAYLHTQGINEDEVVCVLPVDPYVNTSFFERIKALEDVVIKSKSDLALIGVTPTYPSEKYGYIVPTNGTSHKEYINVDHFREKPSEEKASLLIKQGALWNCGVFAFRLGYLTDILKSKGLPLNYEELLHQFDQAPKISFDYEVVEKADHIVAISYDQDWKDLGTWNTLTEEMADSVIGNGKLSNDCNNTHIINELDIPIMGLGLTNTVIAASPDGILVSDKVGSPRLKEELKDFKQDRPMYEERRWGWYKVLDYIKSKDGKSVLTKRIGLKAGKNLSYQYHYQRQEVWTIVSGQGEFILNNKKQVVDSGDVLKIPVEAKHAIKAITDLEMIEVQMGANLVEEDIVRISLDWEETLKYVIE